MRVLYTHPGSARLARFSPPCSARLTAERPTFRRAADARLKGSRYRSAIRSFVKARRLLEPGVGDEVVLNPQLGAGILQKCIDGGSGRRGLGRVEFGRRDAMELP